MQAWSTEEIKFLADRINLETQVIFKEFTNEFDTNRSYDSVQKRVKKLRDVYSVFPDDEEDEPSTDTHSDQLQRLLNDKPSLAVKRESKDTAKEWLKGVVEVGKESVQSPSLPVISKNSSLCVLLSDTHFGKQTKWFNMETAKQRMLSIPASIKRNRIATDIDEVVVILAGDMIEGEDIYPTQNGHIECSAIEQVKVCSETIWQTLLEFRRIFKCRVRVETCPGNHGRVSRTANEETNWDNVIYYILRTMASMKNDKDLVVNCNFEEFRTFPVKDKTVLIYHHGVKHTGTPAMREKVAGWMSAKKFDILNHGHWHEWHVGNWLGKFVVGNGCMCGPDDLSERMGQEDEARQAYYFITPGEPISGFSFIQWDRIEL